MCTCKNVFVYVQLLPLAETVSQLNNNNSNNNSNNSSASWLHYWWGGRSFQLILLYFVIDLIFVIPRGHMPPRVQKIVIIIINTTMLMVLSSWPKSLHVHLVHLMNVDWAPGGCQLPDQANRQWVRRKLAATIYIHNHHCYCYSARRLILILPSHWGWKAESTCTLQWRCAAHAQGCISQQVSW